MNKILIDEKLQKIFYECDKHIQRVNSASTKMSLVMPLDGEKYINLNEDEIEHIDQFLFRFAKLQDAMGQKLFKNILLYIDEDLEAKPFIDILNRMEKLNLLDSANVWRELRNDRNELAHNYEDQPEFMSETINKLYNKKEVLIDIYKKIKSYYETIKENKQ
jgi:hypothetical protein